MAHALAGFHAAKGNRGARLVARTGADGRTVYFCGALTTGGEGGWTAERGEATRYTKIPHDVLGLHRGSATVLA